MLEVAIERDFRRYCIENDVLCLKMLAAGDNGYPDRFIIGQGFMFFIEFKSPKCYPTPLQIYTHEKLRDLGQDVYCFNTNGDAQLGLNIYLCGISPEYVIDDKGITLIIGNIPELTEANG